MVTVNAQLFDDPLYKAAKLRARGMSWLTVGRNLNCSDEEAERMTLEDNSDWNKLLRMAEKDVFRELVAAVADPVRPGQQQLAARTGAHLGGGEAVQQLTTAGRVLAEGGADLGDQGALVAQLERVLLTGREGLAHLNR